MANSRDLFHPEIPEPERVPLFNIGWLRCGCGLVWWIWPVGTGYTPAYCTGTTGAPSVRPIRGWTCWRGIKRVTEVARHG